MATVTYLYTVNQQVFNVDMHDGVREAVVKEVDITITNTGADIEYTIAFMKCGPGTTKVKEDTLFPDIDSALADYKILVISNEC